MKQKEYKDILNESGKNAVELYRIALEENDRVATGKTRDSIRYEVKVEGPKVKLVLWALDHIRDLETGQTASQIQSKDSGNLFNQIQEWVQARNIGGSKQLLVSARIYRSLLKNGWNTELPNRTGQNGGTAGLITNVDEEVTNNAVEDVKKGAKNVILAQLKPSIDAVNDNQ